MKTSSSVLLLALAALLAVSSAVSAAAAVNGDVDRPFPRLSMAEVNASNVREALAQMRSSAAPNGGAFGVDVSQGYGNAASWQCMRGQGYSFAIVRAWQSVCRFDPNVRSTVSAAWAGGMQHVDVYLFPAFRCGLTAAQQVQQTINGMSGVKFGQLWLDIESAGSSWGSAAQNLAWLREAVNTAVSMIGRARVGIYTNKNNWAQVIGSSSEFASFPVWYAHYDGVAGFSDWSPFGGWSKPAIKQFADGPTVCGMGVDHNWYPM